jgi:hypothetical protein
MVKWWRAFKRFVADLDELQGYYDGLWKERIEQAEYPRTPADLEDDAEWCQKLTAKCRAGFERFDSPHNYEEDDEGDKVLKTAPIGGAWG